MRYRSIIVPAEGNCHRWPLSTHLCEAQRVGGPELGPPTLRPWRLLSGLVGAHESRIESLALISEAGIGQHPMSHHPPAFARGLCTASPPSVFVSMSVPASATRRADRICSTA
jgi:hypothetical protein